ncbi:MAG TPA: hypothetical protein DCR93_14335 [Cytophagales bacterium]|nr:hypothetical protein [Cytophagales bacterium]HAP60617.1 hypothetical protein [Cytophagales bacterium]
MKNTLILSLALAIVPLLASAQEEQPEDLYLSYTLRGGIEVARFEIGSRIQLWEYGKTRKRTERIVDVIEGFVVLEKSGPIAMTNIRQLSRLDDFQHKQIRAARTGAGASVAVFIASILVYNNSIGVGESVGLIGAYASAALAPSLFASQFLIARKYRTTYNYYFTMGPLESSEPGQSQDQPPAITRQSAPSGGNKYTYARNQWSANVPRAALSFTTNGDGSFAPQIEYMLGPRFNVGIAANPLYPVSVNAGAKYYFTYYEPKNWNVYYNGKIGLWNSLFRFLDASGAYGGVGIERYSGKRLFWSAQLGAWIDPFQSQVIPEISGSIGIRIRN